MRIFLKLFLLLCVCYCVGEDKERSFGDYFEYEMPKFSPQYYEDDLVFRGKKGESLTTRPRVTGADALKQTFFQSLEGYAVQATEVAESTYPWMARVVHSRTQVYPYVCTAICIEARIFITAARCLASLKVAETTVIFHNERYPALVFVLPTTSTKQMFDDIGVIVVTGQRSDWPSIPLHTTKRTDDDFDWFAKLHTEKGNYLAIGYVTDKFVHKLKTPQTVFTLRQLKIIVDIHLCETILSKLVLSGYFVPCYHSCNIEQFKLKNHECQKYLGAEGAVVYDVTEKKALGISTWGPSTPLRELPVGFSVPNSNAFFNDLDCARLIRDDQTSNVTKGHYQRLCKDKK